MLVITVIVVCVCVVLTLALAASSSGVGGSATVADEHTITVQKTPVAFKTSHDGVAAENQPLVSAAGLQ